MTDSAHPRNKQGHQSDAERELARAQGDFQRLRQAYMEIAGGEANEVALAMVGADMERANAALQSLSGPRPLPVTDEPGRVMRREALQLAQEDAAVGH